MLLFCLSMQLHILKKTFYYDGKTVADTVDKTLKNCSTVYISSCWHSEVSSTVNFNSTANIISNLTQALTLGQRFQT